MKTAKISLIIAASLFFAAASFSGCSGDGAALYTVTYVANGATTGTVPAEPEYYREGTTVTVLGNTGELAKGDEKLLCWSTSPDGTGISYGKGHKFTITEDTVLYAEYGNALKFSSTDQFTIKTANKSKNWNGTLYYSTDKENWETWDGTEISSGTANAIYFRGTGNHKITGDSGKNFVITHETGKTVSCTGNIENLQDYATVKAGEHPVMAERCYFEMFKYCYGLSTAPELPAETLSKHCYFGMFSQCSGLITAPELPATILAVNCYWGMFEGCTGLTTAPELPATILAVNCYWGMFEGCTKLTAAPELKAVTLADSCYAGMFYGCTNLNYIKMMATDISATDCLENWVDGVASTGTFVKNSAATWTVSGASGIPDGWTVDTASE